MIVLSWQNKAILRVHLFGQFSRRVARLDTSDCERFELVLDDCAGMMKLYIVDS
jgi:hypothetical protein